MTVFWDTRTGKGLTYVIAGIVGMVIASIGTSYLDFRKDHRAAIEADYKSFNEAAVEFDQLLKEYANKAKAGAPINSDTESKFQNNIIKLYDEANQLGKRDPVVKMPVKQYSDALVRLDDARKKLHGPLDASQFISALSAYWHARGELADSVAKTQGTFVPKLF